MLLRLKQLNVKFQLNLIRPITSTCRSESGRDIQTILEQIDEKDLAIQTDEDSGDGESHSGSLWKFGANFNVFARLSYFKAVKAAK